jgi:hypothetical protein
MIEDIVCSLDLSIKLKELGIKQESLYSWCEPIEEFYKEENKIYNKLSLYINNEKPAYCSRSDYSGDYYINTVGCGCCSEMLNVKNSYAAFTSNELWKMLPDTMITYEGEEYCIGLALRTLLSHVISDYKLSDALAKVLIYLIENKLYELNK